MSKSLRKAVDMAQVSIIGGGNVGANAGFFIAEKGVTDVLLVDIQPGLARGKMLDIMEAAPIRRYRNFLSGSDSLEDIKGSEFVVVAAGAIRSPGMRREELFTVNAGLVRSLAPRDRAAGAGQHRARCHRTGGWADGAVHAGLGHAALARAGPRAASWIPRGCAR